MVRTRRRHLALRVLPQRCAGSSGGNHGDAPSLCASVHAFGDTLGSRKCTYKVFHVEHFVLAATRLPTGRKTSRLRSLCLERVLFGTETRWGLYIRQKLKRGLFVAGLWIGVDQNRLHSEKQ